MFPIRDHNPSNITPLVTYSLIAINVIVFVATAGALADPRAAYVLLDAWALVPAEFAAEPLTLLSSMFLHGGILHLAGNMLFLFIFGDNLEEELGRLGFFGFYLASGFGAALAQVVADPASTVPMVGASGAIAGVMGGYLLLFPRARVDVLVILVVIFRVVPVPAWLMLGFWFVLQLGGGAMTPTQGGGVAYWAHAGGFAVGLALMIPAWLGRGGPRFWRQTHGHPAHPPAHYKLRETSIPAAGRRRR